MTAMWQSNFWQIVSGREKYCWLVDGGKCVTDGEGEYGPNERCIVKAVQPLIVSATQYEVGPGFDYLTIGDKDFDVGVDLKKGPQGVRMETGTEMKWQSDSSGFYDGFKVCASSTKGMLVDLFGWLGYIDRWTHWID